MFIDIHGHTRRNPGPFRSGQPAYSTPEQLISRYDELGIERAVMLPGIYVEAVPQPQSVEEIIEVSEENNRFIPFCNVDPRAMTNSPDAPLNEILEYYKKRGCKGVGEITFNLPLRDPRVQNLCRHVEALDLPMTIHMSPHLGYVYGLYDDPGLPQLELTLQRFPKLKILAHSQVFWSEIAELDTIGSRGYYPTGPVKREGAVPKLMRKYPNLYGDLSAGSGWNALARDEDYAARFLAEFQDRLLFGTDISMPSTKTPLVDLLLRFRQEERISESVFQRVARENAIEVLKL